MKKTNNFNFFRENEHYKQEAEAFALNKNYREVINCYVKIAKNIKMGKKAEENKTSKRLFKSRLKKIKELIKDLTTVSNASNEIFSIDKYFLFKDLQDSYCLFENFDLSDEIYTEQVYTEQDEIFQIRERTTLEKNCYACKREITFSELKNANPSIDEEQLMRLCESPFIEFYCCNCFEIQNKAPSSLVRSLICYLNFLEKDIEYLIKRLWNLELSGIREEEMKFYLEEIIKIKNEKPNDFTQDKNLISLIEEFIPDFSINDSTIVIHQTKLYHKFEDYEKVIIFIARKSPFFGEMVVGGDSIPIPKRFQTSNFSKAKGFYYKNKRGSNRFYLTDFGCRKFFQISFQIEKKIDLSIGLSSSFNIFFNL